MDCEASMCDLLERMLLDASIEPTNLPLSLLKNITNNFSVDQQIGSGGFSVVYKGLLPNCTVAVKKLSQTLDVDERKFNQEVISLMRVKHKNIVRFLGYCADTQGKVWRYEEKNIIADVRQRLLCFEFLPKGSLDQYITDASHGLEWKIRCQIVKGICEGLHYLHRNNILHLDLKPANILLNDNMIPKITDFGLSRWFDEKQSRAITSKLFGSQGYVAPEFFSKVLTFKLDIYSLGVIILEILTGHRGYTDIEPVIESWKSRLKTSERDTQLEQVRVCAEIGIKCIESNPEKRPDTQCIIQTLHEMKCTDDFFEIDLTSSATHDEKDSADELQGTPKVPGETSTEGTEYCLKFYMKQVIHGPNHNQINIADPKQPLMFGYTNVHDYPIYDRLGPGPRIIARVQGLHTETNMNNDDWFHWCSIVFSADRFQGSSLKAMGNRGNWAIVGGTGVFTFAQGTISIRTLQDNGNSRIMQIQISAFCGTTSYTKGTEYCLNFCMRQAIHGPNHNQINIADPEQPLMFGYTNVHDYPIYDSLGPGPIIARAQGLHTETNMNNDDWFHWCSIVFSAERFQGSCLNAMGNRGNWAIVGGTGVFTFAQGTISICTLEDNGNSRIMEIQISAFCGTPSYTKTIKNGLIMVDSNEVTSAGSPSMTNAQSSGEPDYNLNLYMDQTIDGPYHKQVNIADPKQPQMFGCTNVHDYPIYDSLGPHANIIARVQGLHTETSMKYDDWFYWSSIVFIGERFSGSSFAAIGNQNDSEWAIVGGTGEFTFAKGTIFIRDINSSSNVKEIRISAFCRKLQTSPTDTEVGGSLLRQ
ncbi:hypothetical protein BS78_05G058200 [Paspalum vaginatum]|nr:hypothetical protein BS78_05G058200 [Paspalum vaginatum]